MTGQFYCMRPECLTTAGCQCRWRGNQRYEATPITPPRVGWECPRCHMINAPHVGSCECRQTGLAGAGGIPVSAPKSWGRAN